jgi:hypothetical protein
VQPCNARPASRVRDASGEVRRCMQTLRLSAEEARRLAGDVIPLEGGRTRPAAWPSPCGCRWAWSRDHAFQLAAQHGGAQGRPGAGRGQRGDPQAVHAHAADGLPARRGAAGGRRAARLPVRAARRPRWCACCSPTSACASSPSPAAPRSAARSSIGGTAPHADGAGLDRLHHALRRRQPRLGAAQDRQRRLPQGRPGLHLGAAAAGARVDRRQVETALTRWCRRCRTATRGPDTVVGPVISEDAAWRIEAWIEEAVARRRAPAGRRAAPGRGGPADAAGRHPRRHARGLQRGLRPRGVHRALRPLDEAIARVNATPYGLAAGIFTNRSTTRCAPRASCRSAACISTRPPARAWT